MKFKIIIFIMISSVFMACSNNDDSVIIKEEEFELDKVYVVYENAAYKLDVGTGTFGEVLITLPYSSDGTGSGNIHYAKESDAIYSSTYVDCGQTGGCSATGTATNLTNDLEIQLALSGDVSDPYARKVYAVTKNKLFFVYKDFDPVNNENIHRFQVLNLNSMEISTIRDFNDEGVVQLPLNAIHLESTNELIGRNSNGDFIRTNLDNFTVTEVDGVPFFRKLLITSSEKIYGWTYYENQIVEVDPISLETSIIYESQYSCLDFEYSESYDLFIWTESAPTNGMPRRKFNVYDSSTEELFSIFLQEPAGTIFVDD